ncbi:RNA polymerase beta subunit protrusion [Trinorchestia longiramus]|nr:RNA polymerase beta subunit protrusion [Trinorchestia longiramus]
MPKSAILPLKHLHDGKYGEIPEKENEALLHLSDPMVESFNFAIGDGLQTAIDNIPSVDMTSPHGQPIIISLVDAKIHSPKVIALNDKVLDRKIYPRQCIEAASSYRGSLEATFGFVINNKKMPYIDQNLGQVPIMVKSKLCSLHGLTPRQLVDRGENVNDPGGYFIINGSRKILRTLTTQRRHYPTALTRDSWRHRQKYLTDKGVIIQCIAKDETCVTNILHYLNTGTAKLEFIINKRKFLVDLAIMLKVFRDVNDREIVTIFAAMRGQDTFFIEKVKQMLTELGERNLFSREQCCQYIGNHFRPVVRDQVPSWYTDAQVCNFIVERCVFIHLPDNESKFYLLCHMACKLYAYVAGDTTTESVDVWSMMEAQIAGFVYLKYLKEKLQESLMSIKTLMYLKLVDSPIDFKLTSVELKKQCVRARKVGPAMESMVTTGTISTKTGMGMFQHSGLSIVLEGLNRMRDLSHLRAIHRGSFFLTMKTVLPRRLTGEAWGFICPVHTPDGAPCGLLNHLSYNCTIPAHPDSNPNALLSTLKQFGLIPMTNATLLNPRAKLHLKYPVLLDGRLVGYYEKKDCKNVAFQLRIMKTRKEIYPYTEIVYIEHRPTPGQMPGLYLFTTPARLMRPVVNLHTNSIEFIGTFEQMYLNVAITTNQIKSNVHTHVDVDKIQMFSNIGNLVPFSDCNPNPRNMYQCQMGKQSMGMPLHTWRSQALNKAYRLQYPQVPLVRNAHYDKIDMQDHCMGFNAVLAIVSYTGYDIEDAMTVNKSSMERGLAHGQVYKTEYVNIRPQSKRHHVCSDATHIFCRDPDKPELEKHLDAMGLPYPGSILVEKDPYYCTLDLRSRSYRVVTYKGETCVVDKVWLIENMVKESEVQKIGITIRAQRNPTIGDKFASRSGQKGIMSRLYPTEDLPFSERGIMPDIIFNPHGIPSRMTAGKLLEVIAGKAAAEFALSFDSTPFEFNDDNPAAEYFGSILEKAGFNYFGEDTMYSGVDGRMLETKVYQGIMYYQRLRHMTEDKYQVRSTGAVDVVTRQPIKGRKRGGAIRFGEMERDALIAHGAVFTLKDRLLDCSDSSMEWACSVCGCLLSAKPMQMPGSQKHFKVPVCALCGPDAKMAKLQIPYAFKYLVAELASIGIFIKLTVNDHTE